MEGLGEAGGHAGRRPPAPNGTEVVASLRAPHPADPFRPVDWRARRCHYLVEQARCPSRGRDDQCTRQAWSFFRALARSDDDRQRGRLRRRHPDLAAAVELRESADAFRRWEVEGRLLAGESFAAIAEKTSLTAGAVEAYACLYFDVLDGLAAVDWVVVHVLRYTPDRPIAEDDAGTFLRLYAYFGGTHVLDALLGYFRDPEPIPLDVAQVPPERRERAALHLHIRAVLAARCAPYGDPRVEQFTRLAERLEALAPGGAGHPDQPGVDLVRLAGEQAQNTGTVERGTETRTAS
jgi:hypothetical protein